MKVNMSKGSTVVKAIRNVKGMLVGKMGLFTDMKLLNVTHNKQE